MLTPVQKEGIKVLIPMVIVYVASLLCAIYPPFPKISTFYIVWYWLIHTFAVFYITYTFAKYGIDSFK